MRRHLKLAERSTVPPPKATQERLEIGATETMAGPRVYIRLGGERVVYLTAERAEEICVDLRNFALEVRRGGQVA